MRTPESPRASLTMLGGEKTTPESELSDLLCKIPRNGRKILSIYKSIKTLPTSCDNIPASQSRTANRPFPSCSLAISSPS